MSDRHPTEVELRAQRYVDGELSPADREAFEAQLVTDAELRAAMVSLRGAQQMFEPERADLTPVVIDPQFHARVSEAIRRTPLPSKWQAEEAFPSSVPSVDVAVWSRRVVAAAVLLGGLALLVSSGLLRRSDSEHLQASPAEMSKTMDELDARILGELDRREGVERR